MKTTTSLTITTLTDVPVVTAVNISFNRIQSIKLIDGSENKNWEIFIFEIELENSDYRGTSKVRINERDLTLEQLQTLASWSLSHKEQKRSWGAFLRESGAPGCGTYFVVFKNESGLVEGTSVCAASRSHAMLLVRLECLIKFGERINPIEAKIGCANPEI